MHTIYQILVKTLFLKNRLLTDLIFQFICSILYATFLESSSPYCVILATSNVRHQNRLVSDMKAMQYVPVETDASTDECRAPSYKILTMAVTVEPYLNTILIGDHCTPQDFSGVGFQETV